MPITVVVLYQKPPAVTIMCTAVRMVEPLLINYFNLFYFFLNYIIQFSGYTCDVKDGRCNKGEISIKIFSKFAASKFVFKTEDFTFLLNDFQYQANSMVCPDGYSFCPNYYTCCLMDDDSYGCCPLENVFVFFCFFV